MIMKDANIAIAVNAVKSYNAAFEVRNPCLNFGQGINAIKVVENLSFRPKLIILDEPIVGCDPLLRQKIWCFLEKLSKVDRSTIIITTHYIEETRRADYVAFMQNESVVTQNSPNYYMQTYQCKSLEAAFLQICSKYSPAIQESVQCIIFAQFTPLPNEYSFASTIKKLSSTVPSFVTCIVNEESPPNLSVLFMNELENSSSLREIVHPRYNKDYIRAEETVKNSEVVAFLHFKQNFSESFLSRILMDDDVDDK
ncbi:ABC transporter G family member 23-like protein, partial [Dinothrombium tinctorium]